MQKPKEITLAVRLYCISVMLGLLRVIMHFDVSIDSDAMYNFLIIGCGVLPFAIIAFYISKGKNWARIFVTIIFVAALIVNLYKIHSALQSSLIIGWITIAQTALQIWIIYLLFSKDGNKWFDKCSCQPKEK